MRDDTEIKIILRSGYIMDEEFKVLEFLRRIQDADPGI